MLLSCTWDLLKKSRLVLCRQRRSDGRCKSCSFPAKHGPNLSNHLTNFFSSSAPQAEEERRRAAEAKREVELAMPQEAMDALRREQE